MGIWDRLRGELIDIIEWLDDTRDTVVYRFDRHQNEIKYGAKLVVREGQSACFVNEGQLADVFAPGTHTLTTQNLPILSTLKGWKYGFESPFKAEVYFVSTRVFTDLKWGTMNPVMVRDAEFGPVRLRAFGTYTMRVKDPGTFLKTIVGTDNRLTTDEITAQLRNLIVGQFADILGESKIPMLDLAGNYGELSEFIATRMRPEFERFGLELPRLIVENISLPPEVEAALDRRSSMSVTGNLDQFMKYQAGEAIRDAAKNPGSTGAVLGVGLGGAMTGMLGQQMTGQPGAGNAAGAAVPPPIPGPAAFYLAVNGQPAGPFDHAGLAARARAGELGPGTLVWRQGLSAWTPAGDMPELSALLHAGPPPIPPAPPPVAPGA